MTGKAKQRYTVRVGINFPPDRRAEPGEVVDDIPEASVAWMLEQGVIEIASPKSKGA